MKIALLTCQKLPNLLENEQKLISEFKKYHVTAIPVVWDDETIDWGQFDYLIFRSTWDYYEKENSFNNWLESIKKQGIKTLNAIEIIQENKHKFYLKNLQQKGINILPTVFISKSDDFNLAGFMPKNWQKAVIKPAVSGASYLTKLFDVADINVIQKEYQNIAKETDLLLQEFMPEIQTLGETSFIFFNKQFSYAVLKKAVSGDFRVQSQFGGQYSLIQPSQVLIDQAHAVVNTFESNLLYARVDAIVIDEKLHLMEVECIEPDLYFDLAAGALENFVTATLTNFNKSNNI